MILIKGDARKWYNQAIFIMNGNAPKESVPVDFVAEAERIIHAYVNGRRGNAAPPVKPRKSKKTDYMLNAFICLGLLAIVLVFAYGMFA